MKKALLIILDGYGEGKNYPYNAVTHSRTPFLNSLRKNYPSTLLRAEGEFVGLPKGSMGNSEVGHFTIGAGRVVFQSLEEINRSIRSKKFFKLKELKKAAAHCRKHNSKMHFMGMISDAGVHTDIKHLFALLQFAKQEKLQKVFVHAITDGRDVPEHSAEKYIKQILAKKAKIATIVGRYYAMDRDQNFDRTKKAFDLYTLGKGTKEASPIQAIKNEYRRGTATDYYIKPILLDKNGLIEKNDVLVFFNYRTDRGKQITQMFTKKNSCKFVCFGPYSKTAPVLFPPNTVKNNLGETISKNGLRQLRVAETEKYAHVTFFFNSQVKEPYKGEKQILVPSSKVPSYDLKPEMSAPEITSRFLKELDATYYSFILLNFANCDLVGHSGKFKAVVKGIETVDHCLAKIVPAALKKGYQILITSDHGNAEFMRYPNGEPCPSHTTNPVIFMMLSNQRKSTHLRHGKTLGLANIAPTILQILGIPKPKEMTGKSLLNM